MNSLDLYYFLLLSSVGLCLVQNSDYNDEEITFKQNGSVC